MVVKSKTIQSSGVSHCTEPSYGEMTKSDDKVADVRIKSAPRGKWFALLLEARREKMARHNYT